MNKRRKDLKITRATSTHEKSKLVRLGFPTAAKVLKMDKLVENPGLSFLAVDIFTLLDIPSLLRARCVCKSWKYVIEERLLWKKKMEYFRLKYGQLFFYYW